MRGVPRERRAISARATGGTRHAEHRRRALDDPLELFGLVVLEVGGEAEAVAQRVGQQPRPRRRADEGERREVERDARRPGALADHDVDAEVLHREVQHLLGGARHAVHLVDEEHLAGREARQQRGEVAGVLDRRTAREPQRPAALVRDDHRERRLAESGRTGQQDVVGGPLLDARGVEQQLQLAAHLLLADELRERGRAQRALDRELGLVDGLRRRRAASSTDGLLPRGAERGERAGAAAPAPTRDRRPAHRRRRTRRASIATRSDQPSPTSACTTCAETAAASRGSVPPRRRAGACDLAGELHAR